LTQQKTHRVKKKKKRKREREREWQGFGRDVFLLSKKVIQDLTSQSFKGIVQTNMKTLSSLTHPHIVPNLSCIMFLLLFSIQLKLIGIRVFKFQKGHK